MSGKENIKDIYPLSPMQEAMLYHSLMDENSGVYFEQYEYTFSGSIDIALLKESFNALVQRYDAFRTVFIYDRVQRPQQIVMKEHSPAITCENIEGLGENEKIKYLEAYKDNDRKKGFRLSKEAPFRLAVIKLDESRFELIVSFHHILMDGWCLGIIFKDFFDMYGALKNKKPVVPRAVEPYSTYIQWLKGQELEKGKEYWTDYLEGYGQTAVLPGRPAAGEKTGFKPGEHCVELDEAITGKLAAIAGENFSTMNTLFETAWGVLLQKYNQAEDVVFGRVVSGRPSEISGVENMVGLFINTVPVRVSGRPSQTFSELLRVCQEKALESKPFDYYPLADIQAGVLRKQGLINHILVYENYPVDRALNDNLRGNHFGFKLEGVNTYEQTNYDLNVIIVPGKRVKIKFGFNSNVFSRETVEGICRHFCELIGRIAENPGERLSGLEIMAREEKERVLHGYNDTYAAYPGGLCIHTLFEEQVEKAPMNMAVVFNGESLTYRELNAKANQLARLLREKGAARESLMGIMVERSLEMIIGIWGILKAGGAYVPISPEYPSERVNYILENSGAKILLTQEKFRNRAAGRETIALDGDIYRGDQSNPENINTAADVMYAIYTSGSTGKPKGVLIRHESVANLVWALSRDIYGMYLYPHPLNVALLAPYVFDASVQQIFAALLMGHRLHIVPEAVKGDGEKLIRYYIENNIHISDGTPTHIGILTNSARSFPGEMKVKHFIIGGEALLYQPVKEFYHRFEGGKPCITNVYGPTECCVDSTGYLIQPERFEELDMIPIGKPLANVRIYILGKNLEVLPKGVAGEIYIAGDGVGAGYLNDPRLTAERFTTDPHVPGQRMYRSGDLGRWLPDGNIEYLGRMDNQVKIRGFRIELREIENCILKHGEIKEAAVVAVNGDDGDKQLCAYFTADRRIPASELKEHAAAWLPPYMVPACFSQLDSLPLSTNGKLDRNALPSPSGYQREAFEAPGNITESRLLALWKSILGMDRIGVNDNFFDMGGHSLKTTMLSARIQKEFNVKLPLKEIFSRPTVRKQAELIRASAMGDYRSIEKAGEKEYYPLSSPQKRLYIYWQLNNADVAYNLPVAVMIDGPLDTARLERVFAALINRHEALRTAFELKDGVPVQRIYETVPFGFEKPELGNTPIKDIIRSFVRPFDLSRAPLFRAAILKLPGDRHVLMYDMHHIISDGVTMNLIMDEAVRLYRGEALEPLHLQYRDYSEWFNGTSGQNAVKSREQFWLGIFKDEIPVLNMPTDYTRPSEQSREGGRISILLERDLADRIGAMARDAEVTSFMLLFAAYNVLLAKYAGQEDIIVGTPVAGRTHDDLKRISGMFTNTLALRSFPGGEKTFTAFLAEVRESCLNAYENQDYPFENLLEKLELKRDISRNPLFDTYFSMQNTGRVELQAGGLAFSPLEIDTVAVKADLQLDINETEAGLRLDFHYCTGLYRKDTVERMAKHYKNILAGVLENSAARIGEIEMLSGDEKQWLVYGANETGAGYPEKMTIHGIFEAQAAKYPGRTAVVCGDSSITYEALNRKANQLAHVLRKKGVRPDSRVGIMLERSIDLIAGVLGILKAGAAYLPIEPEYPGERIRYMLEDSGAEILLMDNGQWTIDNEKPITVINLKDESLYDEDDSNLENINKPADLAYIIYTSGTTGNPKGVMIEHRNVVRLLYNDRTKFDFGCEDTWTLFHSICFDFSVWEVFGALLYGGKLVVVPRMAARDPEEYLNLLKQHRVTVVNQTPTAFVNLSRVACESAEKQLAVRYIIFGGEALKPSLVREWREKYPQTRFVNMYGITETTVHVTYKEISGENTEDDISNIGKPIPTMTAYIMDRNMRLLPVGVPGELCVGGLGVGRGYINRPELTAEKFISNPYKPGERLYRSGDLARMLPGGDFEYLGRIDRQVKIRGHRIELGEIETRMLKIEGVRESVVHVLDDKDGNRFLCGYFTAEGKLELRAVKGELSKHLPEYMVPAYFRQLEAIPVTKNGKVDRSALPAPEIGMDSRAEYAAPRNEREEKLAAVWQEVLGVGQVGIHDNFFELGGDSIKAIQVSSRLTRFGLVLEIKNLFKYPRISELSGYVKETGRKADQGAVEGEVILTPVQRRFFEKPMAERQHFNHGVMLYKRDGFDAERLGRVLEQIAVHHDALRMVFREEGNAVVQYNRGICEKALEMRVVDLSGCPAYAEAIEEDAEKTQGSINLKDGPLFKAVLYKTPQGDHLLLVIHHLVVDGVSFRILLEDVTVGYEQAVRNEEIKLPEKTDSYKRWGEKLLEYANSSQLAKEADYWKKLSGIQAKPLPMDFDAHGSKHRADGCVNMELDEESTELLLNKVNRAYNTEINDILLTALGMAVSDWTKEDKVLISLEGHGREEIIREVDIKRTVGWFTAIYPVVLDMSFKRDMGYQIKSVKEELRRIPNKGIGYGIWKYMSEAGGGSGPEPEISFNYLGQFDREVNTSLAEVSGISPGKSVGDGNERRFAVDINGMIAGGRLAMSFSYSAEQYKKATMEQLAGSYKGCLEQIIRECAGRKTTEASPSDLGSKTLSIKELDKIKAMLKNKLK